VSLAELAARVERLESESEIRQLVARYSLALDMRDLDSLCGLFPEDVRVGREQRGRDALKRWFDDTLRGQFTGTAHVTGNHLIEFDAPPRSWLRCPSRLPSASSWRACAAGSVPWRCGCADRHRYLARKLSGT
jgi:SnoaL-like domain